MDEIIDFLISNKEWVFSGIGIFILGGLATLVKLYFSKKKKTISGDMMTQINHTNATGTQIGVQNNYYGKDNTDE